MDTQKFTLSGKPFEVTVGRYNYNIQRKQYIQYAKEARKIAIRKYTKNVSNEDWVLLNWSQIARDIVMQYIEKTIDMLVKNKVYNIDKNVFIKEYYDGMYSEEEINSVRSMIIKIHEEYGDELDVRTFREDLRKELCENVFKIHYALVKVLNDILGMPIDVVFQEDKDEAKIMFDNLSKVDDEEEKKNVIIKIIEKNPYEPEYYRYILQNKFASVEEVAKLASFFDIDYEEIDLNYIIMAKILKEIYSTANLNHKEFTSETMDKYGDDMAILSGYATECSLKCGISYDDFFIAEDELKKIDEQFIIDLKKRYDNFFEELEIKDDKLLDFIELYYNAMRNFNGVIYDTVKDRDDAEAEYNRVDSQIAKFKSIKELNVLVDHIGTIKKSIKHKANMQHFEDEVQNVVNNYINQNYQQRIDKVISSKADISEDEVLTLKNDIVKDLKSLSIKECDSLNKVNELLAKIDICERTFNDVLYSNRKLKEEAERQYNDLSQKCQDLEKLNLEQLDKLKKEVSALKYNDDLKSPFMKKIKAAFQKEKLKDIYNSSKGDRSKLIKAKTEIENLKGNKKLTDEYIAKINEDIEAIETKEIKNIYNSCENNRDKLIASKAEIENLDYNKKLTDEYIAKINEDIEAIEATEIEKIYNSCKDNRDELMALKTKIENLKYNKKLTDEYIIKINKDIEEAELNKIAEIYNKNKNDRNKLNTCKKEIQNLKYDSKITNEYIAKIDADIKEIEHKELSEICKNLNNLQEDKIKNIQEKVKQYDGISDEKQKFLESIDKKIGEIWKEEDDGKFKQILLQTDIHNRQEIEKNIKYIEENGRTESKKAYIDALRGMTADNLKTVFDYQKGTSKMLLGIFVIVCMIFACISAFSDSGVVEILGDISSGGVVILAIYVLSKRSKYKKIWNTITIKDSVVNPKLKPKK